MSQWHHLFPVLDSLMDICKDACVLEVCVVSLYVEYSYFYSLFAVV